MVASSDRIQHHQWILAAGEDILAVMLDVSQLLLRIEDGDRGASEQLLPLVYRELRELARSKLRRERPDHSLQATALVHEAFLRLVGSNEANRNWNGRSHFFAAAAEAMRRILIESVRRKNSQKRGGDHVRIDFSSIDQIAMARGERILALDEALDRLNDLDPVKANLIKLRFFAGLSQEDAANALNISNTTAKRYWAFSRAWLKAQMSEE